MYQQWERISDFAPQKATRAAAFSMLAWARLPWYANAEMVLPGAILFIAGRLLITWLVKIIKITDKKITALNLDIIPANGSVFAVKTVRILYTDGQDTYTER